MTDLTSISTIYQRKLRTVTVRIDPRVIGEAQPSYSLTNSDLVFGVARSIFAKLDDHQEHMVMLVMNARNEVSGYKVVSSGGMAAAVVDPKLVFKSALLLGAKSLILIHNHPSGCVEPSREDWAITEVIVRAGKYLDMPCLDHLILAGDSYTSMREERPSIFNP